jgi:hypothetical protein
MKRVIALGIIAILLGMLCNVPVLALPPMQGIQAVITSPSMNAVVRGEVLIQGSATHPNFWKYEVHVAPEPNASSQWSVIGIHETQVSGGLLETWNTRAFPDGRYSLLLRVVDKTGNYQEYVVRQVSVNNTQPTATPTAAPTQRPTSTREPTRESTPTLIVVQPTMNISPATPTATLAAPTRPPAVSMPGLNFEEWGNAFVMGAGAMGAIFVLVGLLFMIRRLF